MGVQDDAWSKHEVLVADNRYIRWIKDALATDSRLSQAGLARHLDKSPSAISHLLNGRRQLKAHDIARIAAYIGTSPPGERLVIESSEAAASQIGSNHTGVEPSVSSRRHLGGVPVVGRIAQRHWLEGNFVPTDATTIPAAVDDRYPIDVQVSLEVDRHESRVWPELGDYVIAVPVEHRPRPDPRDFVIFERANANGHRNIFAARYEWHDGKLVPIDMDGQPVTESPTWAVIGSHKKLIR